LGSARTADNDSFTLKIGMHDSEAKQKWVISGYSDDDNVYLRLQHGKGFHNLVYMSYIKHINPTKSHK
jgi:hypothetical protein